MSNAIRVTVEGDASGLVEALREGETSLEDFEAQAEETGGRASSTADEIQKLGGNAKQASHLFIDLTTEVGRADYEKLMNDVNKAGNSLKGLGDDAKDAGSDIEVASKKTGPLEKGIFGISKGLIGLATAYAGGRAIKGFIDDAVGAAVAAGVAAPEVERLETAWSKLKLASGTIILEISAPFIDDISRDIQQVSLMMANTQELASAGLKRLTEEQRRAFLQTKEFSETGLVWFTDMEGNFLAQADAIDIWSDIADEGFGGFVEGAEGAKDAIEGILDSQKRWTQADADRFAGQRLIDQNLADLEALEEITRANEEAAKAAEQAYSDFFSSITEGITGETLSLLEGLKFEDLGGDEIIAMLENIKRAFEAGAITREEATAFFGLQFVEEEAFKVIQGIQNEWEASLSIAAALDIDPSVAREMVRKFLDGIDLISSEDLFAAMGLDEEGLEIPVVFQDAGELKPEIEGIIDDLLEGFQDAGEFKPEVETSEIDEAKKLTEEFKRELDKLDGTTVSVKVLMEFIETGAPSPSGTKSPGGAQAAGGGAFAGVPVVVGDAGRPELFTPGSSGSIAPIGAGSNINNKFNQVFAAPINITIQGGDESSLGAILAEPL